MIIVIGRNMKNGRILFIYHSIYAFDELLEELFGLVLVKALD